MPHLSGLAQGFSAAAFVYYGISCLASSKMVVEFNRYGLAGLRLVTGLLQLAGSLGLVAGFYFPSLLLLSSGGLAFMMFLGFLVRVRIRDPFVECLPALFFCGLNLYVFLFNLYR